MGQVSAPLPASTRFIYRPRSGPTWLHLFPTSILYHAHTFVPVCTPARLYIILPKPHLTHTSFPHCLTHTPACRHNRPAAPACPHHLVPTRSPTLACIYTMPTPLSHTASHTPACRRDRPAAPASQCRSPAAPVAEEEGVRERGFGRGLSAGGMPFCSAGIPAENNRRGVGESCLLYLYQYGEEKGSAADIQSPVTAWLAGMKAAGETQPTFPTMTRASLNCEKTSAFSSGRCSRSHSSRRSSPSSLVWKLPSTWGTGEDTTWGRDNVSMEKAGA